jgi:signal transduction histidine kinase
VGLTLFAGWTLARRLQTALAALALLLALAAAAIVFALRQADEARSDQTQRILPARTVASQLYSALLNQQAALRGYALTHQDSYLQPYREGLAQEGELRQTLGGLIQSGDPAHLDLLTLDAAITAWRDEYATFRLHDVGDDNAIATIGFGKKLFDRVRTTNGDLDAELQREADVAEAHADRDRRLVMGVLAITAVLVAAALIALLRALRSHVLRPLQDLGEQVSAVSKGAHHRVIEPVGPPDTREMAMGVESMRLELVGALADVEERKRDLERRATELARSNADLEQFAYVASHDLQEPLRKVASFCQLIEQRYGGQLDERGEQYIAFAVDGAKRMQLLITDLLTFSRVGRTSEGFVPVDLTAIVRKAWSGLEARVAETDAQLDVRISHGHVTGDASLLQMLFANLLGNAVKYRRPGSTPHVAVSSEIDGPMLRVNVADNGIGLPEEYAEKVFVIFQRLHGRDEYDGTGIGLALCKKIVEFHGGTIELRPSSLGGTCLSFTLRLEEVSAHV